MIRKAVIPAAGFGTRFLPATKSQPKEMLPIVDTPVIQYVVEEAVAAGITDILMVIGKGKRAIEEHFDRSFQLEAQLAEKNRTAELAAMRRISELADIHFVWQKEMRGLGDAIYCGRFHVNDEPFAVLLGDTLMDAPAPAIKQLTDVYERYGGPAVLLEEVDKSKVSRYGIADATEIEAGVYRLNDRSRSRSRRRRLRTLRLQAVMSSRRTFSSISRGHSPARAARFRLPMRCARWCASGRCTVCACREDGATSATRRALCGRISSLR